MKRFDYFKITFLFIGTGLTVGLLLDKLFSYILFNETFSIGKAVFSSLFIGIGTALILGILNMYFRILPYKKIKQD
jgi:uncharacterized protein YacL